METCLERLKHYLSEAKVTFEVREHREVFTMQEVATLLHEKGTHVAKVVMALVDEKPAMIVVPAPAHVDFQRVKTELRVTSARQAHEPDFKGLFPDCALGAMPPFGHLYGLPVYVDRTLTGEAEMIFQAGSHRVAMRLATADFIRLVRPIVGDFIVQTELAAA
jgi:Ala-tRNA(Pro) deacylase